MSREHSQPTTLASAVEVYAKHIRLRPRTFNGYRHVFEQMQRFGLQHVEDVTRAQVRLFLESKEKAGNSTETWNRNLVAILSLASCLERLGIFPLPRLLELRRLRVRSLPLPPPRFLTKEEYSRLLAAARAHRPMLGLAVALAVNSGLRMNELRCLHHEDLSLDGMTPFVRVRRTEGREIKTERERAAPIPRAFAAEIKTLGVGPPCSGAIFPAGAGVLRQGALATILGNLREAGPKGEVGRYLNHHTLERWLKHARRAAALGDGVTFITLRHTYASWLVQSNVSIAKVACFLGNGVGVAWRHYVGLAKGGDADVDAAFKNMPRIDSAGPHRSAEEARADLAQQLLALCSTAPDPKLMAAARLVLGEEKPGAEVSAPAPRTAPSTVVRRRGASRIRTRLLPQTGMALTDGYDADCERAPK